MPEDSHPEEERTQRDPCNQVSRAELAGDIADELAAVREQLDRRMGELATVTEATRSDVLHDYARVEDDSAEEPLSLKRALGFSNHNPKVQRLARIRGRLQQDDRHLREQIRRLDELFPRPSA